MGAPSSEQEARELGDQAEARPNLSAVTSRMLELIETLEPGRRKTSLEIMVGCLGTDLRPTEDICDEERDRWLEVLAS